MDFESDYSQTWPTAPHVRIGNQWSHVNTLTLETTSVSTPTLPGSLQRMCHSRSTLNRVRHSDFPDSGTSFPLLIPTTLWAPSRQLFTDHFFTYFSSSSPHSFHMLCPCASCSHFPQVLSFHWLIFNCFLFLFACQGFLSKWQDDPQFPPALIVQPCILHLTVGLRKLRMLVVIASCELTQG